VLASTDYESLASQASSLFSLLLPSISPLGLLYISNPPSPQNIASDLTLAGFSVISVVDETVVAQKPAFTTGTSVSLKKQSTSTPLTRRKIDPAKKKALWSFSSPATETIDPEALLTPEDHVRPAACEPITKGAPRRKKACKGCTCGLAELEEEEKNTQKIVLLDGGEGGEAREIPLSEKDRLATVAQTTSKATSSCGSCFLGDAFRCASCPYLGKLKSPLVAFRFLPHP